MSDVRVAYTDAADAKATALLLVAAATTLGVPQTQIRTVEGAFMVPEAVATEAAVDYFPCPEV